MGEIKDQWLDEEQESEILVMIEKAKEKGLSCVFWSINRRRVVRWFSKKKNDQSLRNLKSGPKEPVHKLLPEERDSFADG